MLDNGLNRLVFGFNYCIINLKIILVQFLKDKSMINYTSIKISSIADYDQLEKTEYFKKYFDDNFIKQLKNYIGKRCKVIELEYPYYDSDYLSSYYNFYVKKFRNYSKQSLRIILFSNTQKSDIIGYITLRPTYAGNYISRLILEPTISNKKCAVMVAPYKIHYRGAEVNLFEFPQIGQESMGAAVCAHVSIWAILRYFSNRFHKYPEMPLSYVAGYKIDRLLDGDLKNQSLTVGGIATILKSQGYSPLLIDKDTFEDNGYYNFREEMFAYILSGFPLIGVSKKSKHAFVIVGIQHSDCENFNNSNLFNLTYRNGNRCNLIPVSNLYPGIIVNDDHHFPYRVVGYTKSETDYKLGEIDSIIVPLYDRISLTFSSVLDFMREWYSCIIPSELGWCVEENMYYNIFLTSYNTYKEFLMSQRKLNQKFKAELMHLETPRFIWCIEFSREESMKNNLVDYIMLLDSTSSTEDELAVLLVTGNKCLQVVDNGKKILLKNYGDESLGISRFNSNLENYN